MINMRRWIRWLFNILMLARCSRHSIDVSIIDVHKLVEQVPPPFGLYVHQETLQRNPLKEYKGTELYDQLGVPVPIQAAGINFWDSDEHPQTFGELGLKVYTQQAQAEATFNALQQLDALRSSYAEYQDPYTQRFLRCQVIVNVMFIFTEEPQGAQEEFQHYLEQLDAYITDHMCSV